MGEKYDRKKKNRTKETPVWLSSYPPVYKIEADCFPKGPKQPALSITWKGSRLKGQKKRMVVRGAGD